VSLPNKLLIQAPIFLTHAQSDISFVGLDRTPSQAPKSLPRLRVGQLFLRSVQFWIRAFGLWVCQETKNPHTSG
jgi:hypothetical protein